MKIERYEDTKEYCEKVRKKADQIIERIMVQAYWFENRVPYGVKPVVFISSDLLAVLAAVSTEALRCVPYPKVGTICGYEIKTITGTDELYIGFKI
jgi:hypothetical protein